MSQVAAAQIHFVLCIRKGEDDDLELRKAYAVLPPAANETGYLRVIDESGEDYLYPRRVLCAAGTPAKYRACSAGGVSRQTPRTAQDVWAADDAGVD